MSSPTATASSSTSPSSPSPSSIPQAPFIEDVEKHLGGSDVDVTPTLQQFQQVMSKYKVMESTTFQRHRSLTEKIPDISKTLEMVRHLSSLSSDSSSSPSSLQTHFELHDTMYAKALISAPVTEVNLWLGANVMLSYPIDEAVTLLEGKMDTAKKSLETTRRDLDYLRDQITTMEVNTARVHNFDVKRRRGKSNPTET